MQLMKTLIIISAVPVVHSVASVRGGQRTLAISNASLDINILPELPKVTDVTDVPAMANLQAALVGALMMGGGKQTPMVSAFIQQIQNMITTQLVPQVTTAVNQLQTTLNTAFAAISSCNSPASAASIVSSLSQQHLACRNLQAAAYDAYQHCYNSQPACQALNTLSSSKQTAMSTCSSVGSENYETMSTRSTLIKQLVLWSYFHGQMIAWQNAVTACNNAVTGPCAVQQSALTLQNNTCNALQDQMDAASCSAYTTQQAACPQTSACMAAAIASYQSSVTSAQAQLVTLRTTYEASLRLSCIANAFSGGIAGSTQAIAVCSNSDYTAQVNSLTLNIQPTPTASNACNAPNNAAGTAAYATANYAILPATATAKQCIASPCCTSSNGR